MERYGFGVDIGGTTVKMGLFKEDGTLEHKWEIKTDISENGRHIFEDIACAIEGELKAKSIAHEQIIGVGVGVPGPVLSDGTVKKCVNLGWGVINVSDILGERLGFSVKVGNDANVAALGEMWLGGGEGCSNVVMLTLGTGVGGGIVLDGKILTGVNGAAGEIGHIKMRDDHSDTCGCGKRGCLEQYASASGLARMAKARLAADDEPSCLRSVETVSAKAVADGAREGDRVCMELLDSLAFMLGTAAANIACVVDPEIFVIGGGLSRAGEILMKPLEKYFNERAFHACEGTRFAVAKLGNDAGIYGCMKMVLD